MIETSSLGDLAQAAADVASARPDVVVLAGGDGSYMAGVTAIAAAFGRAGLSERALPAFALAPGGTVSTVARNWGFRGGGLLARGAGERTRYAARLLDAITSDRAVTMERPTLRVVDPTATRIGFIAGAGLVSNFFEVYEREGARGYAGAASIVARVFAGSFAKGALAQRVLAPVPCALEVDGERTSLERTSLFCASVVRDLGLGLRVLHRAAERNDRFHVVATPLGPSLLGPQLPIVMAGRPLLGRARNVDTLAKSAHLRFTSSDGAYVLDGELLHAGEMTITAGPVLRIVSA